jgi:lytic murein transglycosylase
MLCIRSPHLYCAIVATFLLVACANTPELRAEPLQSPSGAWGRAGFRAWVEGLWPEASALGVSRGTFDKAFKELTPDCAQTGVICPVAAPASVAANVAPVELQFSAPVQAQIHRRGKDSGQGARAPSLPESCNKVSQREFLRPADYFPRDYLSELVTQGQTMLYRWRVSRPRLYVSVLNVQKNYGVSRHILMALWGRETNFGDVPDEHNAVRSLASLAYAGAAARRPWYRKQLTAALKMLDEGHVTFDKFVSSYAGATGLTQIMPGEFLKYAADGDGDARKDVWGSAPDSLATTANVLKHSGWNSALRSWGYEVEAPADRPMDCTLEGQEQMKPIREWVSRFGLRRVKSRAGGRRGRSRPFPASDWDAPAYLVAPAGGRGPAFLVTQNFDVLKSYNPSELYALFVGHVADRITCDWGQKTCEFVHSWPSGSQDDFPFSVENLCRLQMGLKDRGFLDGTPDGLFGPQTRIAIGRQQKASGQKPDCYPNAGIFKALTAPLPPDSAMDRLRGASNSTVD